MAPEGVSYDIAWVDSVADVPEDLWRRCFPPQLEGRWWYEALEYCGLEDQFDFRYGVISAASKPVGIVPVFVMDVPLRLVVPDGVLRLLNLLGRVFPALPYQRTLFVGSPCSDEGAVGLAPGLDREEAYRQVNRAVQKLADKLKAPMRVWKDFPRDSEVALTALAETDGLFPIVSFPGAVVHLSGSTKKSYFDLLKASRRNKLRKKLKIGAAAPLDVGVIQNPTAAELDEIFALFWQTYEKGETKFERLNKTFFRIIGGQPHSSFIVIRERQAGRMVAFMLCFAVEGRVINKFIGIDYNTPKEWFLYFRLWDAVVDLALANGATSIQSGQTGYSAKIELGHELQPLTSYVRHRNPIIHWIYKAVAKTVNWDTLDDDLAVFLKAYPDLRPRVRRKMLNTGWFGTAKRSSGRASGVA
jgi:hypothetical protein